jgi:predicted Fe-Mo cluster-binding NifX family protein
MIACLPVRPDGEVAAGWGRARRVAVASVTEDGITTWQELDVAWDVLHDEGTEGAHHARVARFLREYHVEVVITEHLGAGMARMIGSMGIRLVQGARGDARAAVLAVFADRAVGLN